MLEADGKKNLPHHFNYHPNGIIGVELAPSKMWNFLKKIIILVVSARFAGFRCRDYLPFLRQMAERASEAFRSRSPSDGTGKKFAAETANELKEREKNGARAIYAYYNIQADANSLLSETNVYFGKVISLKYNNILMHKIIFEHVAAAFFRVRRSFADAFLLSSHFPRG